jgi:hypothetical protein
VGEPFWAASGSVMRRRLAVRQQNAWIFMFDFLTASCPKETTLQLLPLFDYIRFRMPPQPKEGKKVWLATLSLRG